MSLKSFTKYLKVKAQRFTKLGEDLLCETLGNTLCNFVLQKKFS